jgi:hypothetical protein
MEQIMNMKSIEGRRSREANGKANRDHFVGLPNFQCTYPAGVPHR